MASPLRVTLIQLGYGDEESVVDRTARVADLVRSVCAAPPPESPTGEPPTVGSPDDSDGRPAAHLVVLPELWPQTAFEPTRWKDQAEAVDGPVAQAMSALAAECGILLHAGSIVERLETPGPEGKSLANTSLLFGADGSRIVAYRKIHRFGFGSVEPQVMEAGGEVVLVELPSGERAALSTCYDLRFPELYRRQLDSDASLFIIPAAWPTARVAAWTLLGQARAIENQCFVLACNTAGTHGGVEMGGHSQVVAPTGAVLATAGSGEEILDLVIDLDDVARARSTFPVLDDRRL